MHTTEQKMETTLNCWSKFIIKANFAIDHKVRSELPKNKLELFTHSHIPRESLLPRYFCKLPERMLRICSAVINNNGTFFDEKEI